ncbi:MAG: aconitate hydratase AcnA [Thermoprotei archaeon]
MVGYSLRECINTYDGVAYFWNPMRVFDREEEYQRLPYSIRVILENVIRNRDIGLSNDESVQAVRAWKDSVGKEIAYFPSRVLLQDATGVPVLVDLAAMRDLMKERGLNPQKINPTIPVELVVDHSVQVDYFGTSDSMFMNMKMEFSRNAERYAFLRWAQGAFTSLRVVPPGKGIIHQINLEYLAGVANLAKKGGLGLIAFPDTLIGTDSHTTMASGAGMLAWGVGGIEAESVMLGQPYDMQIPDVVGVRLTGIMGEGVTATDVALSLTEILRKNDVVGKIVEFSGPGLDELSVEDRATISNMAPEYGATTAFFPADESVINYMRLVGRSEKHVRFVADYLKKTGLLREKSLPEPEYSKVVNFDLSSVRPCIAGPSNPDERIPLDEVRGRVEEILDEFRGKKRLHHPVTSTSLINNGQGPRIGDGIVALAAITSCTNTSNPYLIMGAALLAKKAVEMGLDVKPWVKTTFAPGSGAVLQYLKGSGLMPYLEALRFHVTALGCTVCIGNTGPLVPEVEYLIKEKGLYAVAILSGNRNFQGRIHPLLKASFLASPPLVVAYALAGTINIDLTNDPLGLDPNGKPVLLRDVWPTSSEVREAIKEYVNTSDFAVAYSGLFEGGEDWKNLTQNSSPNFSWDTKSTYIRRPPFLDVGGLDRTRENDIKKARVLLLLGDKVNTDMISPAGQISPNSPAGAYLSERGVSEKDLGTYISRRGNHEVMVRGTFAHPAVKNALVGREGGWTSHEPGGEIMSVFDASIRYKKEGVPLLIIAGKQYGIGSSRDWAAKGPALLGVRAVLAESFERIHRSNLIGMGILPLQFEDGQGAAQLGLSGKESYDIYCGGELIPKKSLRVVATRADGKALTFNVTARLDTMTEVSRYEAGGILPAFLSHLVGGTC